MVIVNSVSLIVFIVLYILSLKDPKEWLVDINKKEYKLYFLYPMAELIIRKTRLDKFLQTKTKVNDSIKALNVTNRPAELQRLYWCNKVATMITIISLFSVLSILGQLGADDTGPLVNGKYLIRPGHGEGSKEVELDVTMDEDTGKSEKDGSLSTSRTISIKVEEQKYDDKEVEKLLEEASKYLKESVLGENISAEAINKQLDFCASIPGTGISVEWKPEDYTLIKSDGTICNKDLKGSITTSVIAILHYQEKKTEVQYSFRLIPKKESLEEVISKELEERIEVASEESAMEDHIELPETLRNYKLYWSTAENTTGIALTVLGIIAALMVWLLGDREWDSRMKKREEQLLIDYPEIINKFALLINAGMTVKQAWSKIAEDYFIRKLQQEKPLSQSKRLVRKKQFTKRYAYDEMLITVNELKLGVSESTAYEQYGRRIGLLPYIRFTSLISQNLKKGNRGFTEQLKQEAMEAFEDRKDIAKRLGEEAGTKLLIPMMLMLIIVFMIILIPGFISFQL